MSTVMGRIYASKKGHAEVADWKLPDGSKYTLQVITRRGSTFGSPTVSARLMNTDDLAVIDTYRGRADGLNAWLHPRKLML